MSVRNHTNTYGKRGIRTSADFRAQVTKSTPTPTALKLVQASTLKAAGTIRGATQEWQKPEFMPKQLLEELKVIVFKCFTARVLFLN